VAPSASDDPLVAKAFDANKHEELARAVEQLLGYLVAMVAWLIGMVLALAYFGMTDGFVGWVFLVPFAVVGVILYLFGRWANKAGSAPPKVGYDRGHEAAGLGDRPDSGGVR